MATGRETKRKGRTERTKKKRMIRIYRRKSNVRTVAHERWNCFVRIHCIYPGNSF
jgi:hypothetical protein